ncbi:MAG: outer membrane lipoprotein carrier protein LolA [Alphaproteobacteria bacterium]
MRMWFGMMLLAAALLVGPSPAGAAGEARTAVPALAKFGPEDRAVIQEVERYLNTVETMKARFLQVSSTGAQAEGDLYLSRPGRMRLAYDPPTPILIVADGHYLIYYDSQLGQVSYLGLDSTPAGIILRSDVRLGGDVTVTGVRRPPGALEISMIQTSDPAAGELTLLMTDNPLTLRQWRVKDAQGQVVTVSLFDARSGVTLDPTLFTFRDPNFFKPNTD